MVALVMRPLNGSWQREAATPLPYNGSHGSGASRGEVVR